MGIVVEGPWKRTTPKLGAGIDLASIREQVSHIEHLAAATILRLQELKAALGVNDEEDWRDEIPD